MIHVFNKYIWFILPHFKKVGIFLSVDAAYFVPSTIAEN